MFCSKCGFELKQNAKFCPKCGSKQTGTAYNNGTVAMSSNNGTLPKAVEAIHEEGTVAGVSAKQKPVAVKVSAATQVEVEAAKQEIAKIWPDWEIVEKIGQGSFGKVFKAKRSEFGTVLYSAIKIIKIPQDSSEVDSVQSEVGLDYESTTAYFKGVVDECINEVKLMVSLKGNENIVSVEDYKVVEHEDEIGWDIYIRMELLQGFLSYSREHALSESDILKLGVDICSALEYCNESNVMHRDIKPENIFVSSSGTFKLGDFGIARKLERATVGLSKKGTYYYMSPEVFNGNTDYDYRADIYSLGVVLYKFLNNDRLPLVDAHRKSVTAVEVEKAFEKRMQGAKLPKPCNAGDIVSNVILTACAYNAADRFADAKVFKAALIAAQNGTSIVSNVNTNTPNPAPLEDRQSGHIDYNATIGEGNKKKVAIGNPEPRAKVKDISSALTNNVVAEKITKAVDAVKAISKTKKIIYSVIAAVTVIAIVTGAVILAWYTGVDQKILRMLKAGDYDEAISIYYDKYDSSKEKALSGTLVDRLDELKNSFKNEEVEYAVVNMEISTIRKIAPSAINKAIDDAQSYIEKINNSKTAFKTAEAFFEKGNYANAIKQYQMVVEEDTNYQSAKENLATAISKYRESVIATAEGYAASEEYVKAITELQSALSVVPDDQVITEKVSVYIAANAEKIKKDALHDAAEYANDGDYKNAIKTISAAMTGENENDTELKTAYNEYESKHVSDVIAAVDKLTHSRKYSEALNKLDEEMELLPNNEVLKKKYGEVESNKPVSLSTLTSLNSSDRWSDENWNVGTPIDPFGVTHTNICNYYIFIDRETLWGDNGTSYYSEYRLYGNYKTITGSIAPGSEIGEDGYGQVKIYADDKLMYTSQNIVRKTDMFNFTVDISNADYIKIEVFVEGGDHIHDGNIMLMDVQLWTD